MALGWASIFMIRMAPSPALMEIRNEFNLSYAEAGLITTAYFYAYLPTQFPSGWIGERLGRRFILSISSMLWGLLSILTAFVSNFQQLIASRVATGLVQGLYFGNDRPTVVASTPKKHAAIGQGISFMGIGIGIVLGIYVGGLIVSSLGWRWVFILFAIPSFFISVMMFTLLKDAPSNGNSEGMRAFYELLRNRDFMILCVAGIPCIYAFWVLATWAPTIFLEIGVGGLTTSSLFASIIGITAIPSLILMGHLSDVLKVRGIKRKLLVIIDITLLAISLFFFGYMLSAKVSPTLVVLTYIVSGLLYWGFIAPLYAMLQEMLPNRLHGTAFGMMNGIQFTGSLISPWLTGFIRDVTGSFAWGIYVSAIMLIFSVLLLLLISPAFIFKEKRLV